MNKTMISVPTKWEQYLKQMADDHQVDLSSIISELCSWAFSNLEGKKQFEAWLDDAFPSKGESEDKEMNANEEISENEKEKDEESEEETHEDRDYNEGRELKP
jgi:hypothetical protein